MSRRIAERGRYPAIDVLKSVTRTLPGCLDPEKHRVRLAARELLATHGDIEELVGLGAYKAGSSAEVDLAVALAPAVEQFLNQYRLERGAGKECFLRRAQGCVEHRLAGPRRQPDLRQLRRRPRTATAAGT